MPGRDSEIRLIRRANRAAAVGKLLLGEFNDWRDYLDADVELDELPRRQLKSGKRDIQTRLSSEINKFIRRNFLNMPADKLELLYLNIREKRGLEIPLFEFEEQFSKFLPQVTKDIPPHATVVISLWGLQFMFPEHFIASDIKQSLLAAIAAREKFNGINKIGHAEAVAQREEISELNQQEQLANRSVIIYCYNLIEAYFNGLAWDFCRDNDKMSQLSINSQNLLRDSGRTSLRDKVTKYPKIISGRPSQDEYNDIVDGLLGELKQFRDSLVHPSPFSVPERFGGYNKLKNFYSINLAISLVVAKRTFDLIETTHRFIFGSKSQIPSWLLEAKEPLSQYEITLSS